MNRLERTFLAFETLQILQKGSYINGRGENVELTSALQAARNGSVLYEPAHFSATLAEWATCRRHLDPVSTHFEVTDETSLRACARLVRESSKVFCLNFASAKKPGGGFLNGSQAQEESLARSTGLYPCLIAHKKMYSLNRVKSAGFYTDAMIYSPDVPVFRTDEGALLDRYFICTFLTAPAVNAGVVLEKAPEKRDLIDSVMQMRMEKILAIAALRGYRTVVLGAWGCGVFKNDPTAVAAGFHRQLRENPLFQNTFERVVFAVFDPSPSRQNARPFYRYFQN